MKPLSPWHLSTWRLLFRDIRDLLATAVPRLTEYVEKSTHPDPRHPDDGPCC